MHKIIRTALLSDIPKIEKLIEDSVMELQANDYSLSQRKAALGSVFGIDNNLFIDATYFVIEIDGEIAACGGWSKRAALFGANSLTKAQAEFLDPKKDAAKIRAFFVSPKYARQGLGKLILETAENAARKEGFKKFELGATLTGIPFYTLFGYKKIREINSPLPNGEFLPIVMMGKPA